MKKKINILLILFLLTNLYFCQIIENFNYNHNHGAFEILTVFVNSTAWLNELWDHGCWCAKLDPYDALNDIKQLTLGGPTTVDELDQACKYWARAKSCTKKEGKSCEGHQGPTFYQVRYSNGIDDAVCVDSDLCLREICHIDLHFTREIVGWKTLTPNFEAVEGNGTCGIALNDHLPGDHVFCDTKFETIIEDMPDSAEQIEIRCSGGLRSVESRIVGGQSIFENDNNPFENVTDWILHISIGCGATRWLKNQKYLKKKRLFF